MIGSEEKQEWWRGVGAGVVRRFHIPVLAEAPLKFKYLSELEIDPIL